MTLPFDPNFGKDQNRDSLVLIINDMEISDPLLLLTNSVFVQYQSLILIGHLEYTKQQTSLVLPFNERQMNYRPFVLVSSREPLVLSTETRSVNVQSLVKTDARSLNVVKIYTKRLSNISLTSCNPIMHINSDH
jgi:hypothetical protein